MPVEGPVVRALREGTAVGLANHTVLIRRDGSERPVDDSAAPIRDADGRIVGCVLVFRDITLRKVADDERRRLLESERAARAEAERASLLKDEFLATLSHELRAPLNAILGWSRLLDTKRSDPETLAKGLEVITRNATLQADLIADLLDMSRIDSGKFRLDVTEVDLSEVVNAGLDAIRHAADAREIDIRTEIHPTTDTIRGDARRLQQVVWNLLSNAVKFTPRGGHITVALSRTNAHASIEVRDTGIGIRPEFLPHLFERFRQGDASAARKHDGLGLGLAIVKHVVELHGGSVKAESAGEGQGATFVVELPIRVTHAGLARATDSRGSAIDLRSVRGHEVDLLGVTVLAIDDQADARMLLTRILQERHAEVIVADGVETGLRAVNERRPDVVLCDIGMPVKDGYSFIAELRGRGDTTPAMAVTAFAQEGDRSRLLRAGYQGYLTKPVEPSQLVAGIAALLGRSA
jgi:signal transduction histidine kinase